MPYIQKFVAQDFHNQPPNNYDEKEQPRKMWAMICELHIQGVVHVSIVVAHLHSWCASVFINVMQPNHSYWIMPGHLCTCCCGGNMVSVNKRSKTSMYPIPRNAYK